MQPISKASVSGNRSNGTSNSGYLEDNTQSEKKKKNCVWVFENRLYQNNPLLFYNG